MSCELHHAANGVCHALPLPRFDRELTAARRGEVVILGAAAQLRNLPLGLDPALMLETMESRIHRALIDLQDVLEICWMRSETAQPCRASCCSVRRIRRSSVPGSKSGVRAM